MILPAILVAGALVLPWFLGWRLRRRFAHSRAELAYGGLPDTDPHDVDPAAMMAIGMQMQALESGRLQRVIGVGQQRTAGGVSVELLAVEIRDVGGIVSLRASGSSRPFRSNAYEPHFPQPQLTLEDDAGTSYSAFPGGGGGSEGIYRYEVRFVPAVPPLGRRLTIRLVRFSDSLPYRTPSSPTIDGPWEFHVSL